MGNLLPLQFEKDRGRYFIDYVVLGKLPKSYFNYSGIEIKDKELEKKLYCNWVENLLIVDGGDYK